MGEKSNFVFHENHVASLSRRMDQKSGSLEELEQILLKTRFGSKNKERSKPEPEPKSRPKPGSNTGIGTKRGEISRPGRKWRRRARLRPARNSSPTTIEHAIRDVDLVEDAETRPRGMLRPVTGNAEGKDKQVDRGKGREEKTVRFSRDTASSPHVNGRGLASPPPKDTSSLLDRLREDLAAEPDLLACINVTTTTKISVSDETRAYFADEKEQAEDGCVTQEVIDTALVLLDMRSGNKRTISTPRPRCAKRAGP